MTKQRICPKDGAALTVQTRFEIEVDICPRCRGVWLDRDELDKILRASRGERVQKNNLVDDAVSMAATTSVPRANTNGGETASGIVDFLEGLFF